MKRQSVCGILAVFVIIAFLPVASASSRTGRVSAHETFTVTFNPNRGTVDLSEKTVSNGEEYGFLPTPVRNGYNFDGWFTEPLDGEGVWITSTTAVNLTQNQTLYAHWTSAPRPRTVKFDPNGGSVEISEKTVVVGSTYGDLPTPVHDKLFFDGWYTNRTGGKLVTRTTIVTESTTHTLYAHWLQTPPGICLVTFKPGTNASVSPSTMNARYDEPYGDLPIPVKRGYSFIGWFTAKTDGEQVTSVSTPPHASTQTLYAQWNKTESVVALSDLTYQFPNSREGFQYKDNYKIDYSRYALIFGDREVARSYYEADSAWGGNCYGMAVTSGMFYQKESGVSVGAFKEDASKPSELSIQNTNNDGKWNGLSLQAFIEAMQISQKSSAIQNEINKNKGRLDDLCTHVAAFQRSGNNPVVIAIARKKAGHAILGYRLEDVSADESHLMVYDSNFPGVERYITLYKSPAGKYIGWYYHMNNQDSWGSNYEGSWISYVQYSSACLPWTTRGEITTDLERELLSVNTQSAGILDGSNVPVATLMEGELHTERSDIFPMLEMAGSDSKTSHDFSVWLPVGEYTIENQDAAVGEIKATMVHWDQSSSVRTDASTVTYLVSDAENANVIVLDEPGKAYEITFHSTLPGAKKQVTLSGVTGDDISADNRMAFAQVNGQLYADHVGAASLNIDGKEGSTQDFKGSALAELTSILTPDEISFKDVEPVGERYEAIVWAIRNGVTKGFTSDTFAPNEPCTRAQILTFLWRAETKATPFTGPNPFRDVPSGAFYENAAKWAYAKGLVSGDRLEGSTPCSRAEAMTYLWKLKGSPDGNPETFTDVPPKAEYARAVAWAVQQGITKGTSGATFSPNNVCTRIHIILFLYRHYFE